MKIVFLTGAGVSAESGLDTFRSPKGIWNNHKIEDVAISTSWKPLERNRTIKEILRGVGVLRFLTLPIRKIMCGKLYHF